MRIPHGVTAFGVGAATTSYILQQQKAEAQKKENDKLRNELSEIKEDLDKIQSSQDEIKKGQEMLIRKVENIETNTKKLINNFNIIFFHYFSLMVGLYLISLVEIFACSL